MRLWELIEGADGKLDEQSMLSIFLCLLVGGLVVYEVVVRGVVFTPVDFSEMCAIFLGGSLGSLTVRSRFSKPGEPNVQPGPQ